MNFLIKRLLLGICVFIVSPFIILTRLEELIRSEELFHVFGGLLSLFPDRPGSYLRVAYYWATLNKLSLDVFISQGSYFSHRRVEIGKNSSLGAYCVIGSVKIGEEVLIASRVSILSGRHQHDFPTNQERKWGETVVKTVQTWNRRWIGEDAIVLADVGDASIVGAGSVVVKPIPDHTVAAGNPAKLLKKMN